jgi:cAMP-dependent protein kinase regulator
MLNENQAELTPSEEDSDEQVDDIQPKKKNIKQQRQGVSAEVYGEFNKKGDFVPKVIKKSEETMKKLSDRLL